MPVTSRALQVYRVSGAGKKAPTNLKWDVAKQRLINVDCECKNLPGCVGTFPTSDVDYGNAICNGFTCYSSNLTEISGLQIDAIPGTTYTLNDYGGVLFIVNCTLSTVYYDNGDGLSGSIDAGNAKTYNFFVVAMTFTFT